MVKRDSLSILGFIALSLCFNEARADWWSNQVRNIADVATLGQAGRDRDEAEARRQADLARAKLVEVEHLKQVHITEKADQLARFDAVITGQVNSLSIASELLEIDNSILTQTNTLLDERKASLSVVEYVRDLMRTSSTPQLEAIQALSKARPPSQSQIAQAADKTKQDATAALIKSMNDAMTAQATINAVSSSKLNESLDQLKTKTLEGLVTLVASARGKTIELRQSLYHELSAAKDTRDGIASELAALGVTVTALPESVNVALKAFQPLVVSPKAPADATSVSFAAIAAAISIALSDQLKGGEIKAVSSASTSTDASAFCHQLFKNVDLKTIRPPC
jgi:23S rRNA pseudoU1915 N3-methylase RlmH